MVTAEFSRRGDLSVAEHLAEMRRRAERQGIHITELRATRVLDGRGTFNAKFPTAADVDRFRSFFAGE